VLKARNNATVNFWPGKALETRLQHLKRQGWKIQQVKKRSNDSSIVMKSNSASKPRRASQQQGQVIPGIESGPAALEQLACNS